MQNIHVREHLNDHEIVRRFEILGNLKALATFLGTRLGRVPPDNLEPKVTMLRLDRCPNDLDDHVAPPSVSFADPRIQPLPATA